MTVPIVFLHGWAMTGGVFDDVIARLGPEYDCHAPDLPGHGTRSTDAPSLEQCTEVVRGLVAQLEDPILVGWSMGAAVAWRYLAQQGTQGLGGLVTIDMSPCLLPDRHWTFGLRGQTADAVLATSAKIDAQWPRMAESILRKMYAPGHALTDDDHAMMACLLKQNPTTLRRIWDDLVAMDERSALSRIDIPYLVCAGQQSQLYDPGVAYWIAQHAPRAEVQLFHNSGHSPHFEEPQAFCEVIRHFAEGLGNTKTNKNKTVIT